MGRVDDQLPLGRCFQSGFKSQGVRVEIRAQAFDQDVVGIALGYRRAAFRRRGRHQRVKGDDFDDLLKFSALTN